MSMHPKVEVKKKVWTTPKVTTSKFSGIPDAHLRDILRTALTQAERDVLLNPNDERAAERKRILERMSRELESKANGSAA